VQDISILINARKSYNINQIRPKDIIQSNFIKHNNFNVIDIDNSEHIKIN